MSLPRPIHPYYFHADLIWWDSPFKIQLVYYVVQKGQVVSLEQKSNTQTQRTQ
jgi:hypothetical protein